MSGARTVVAGTKASGSTLSAVVAYPDTARILLFSRPAPPWCIEGPSPAVLVRHNQTRFHEGGVK